MTTLWLRADGSRADAYRTLLQGVAVADAARRLGSSPAVRCVTVLDPVGVALLDDHGVDVVPLTDPSDDAWIADVAASDALVTFGGVAAAVGARTASVVDDLADAPPTADVVVCASAAPEAGDTRVFTGPAAALVRGEFLAFRRQRDTLFDTLLVSAQRGATDLTADILDLVAGACRVLVDAPRGLDGPDDRPDVEVVVEPPSLGALFDRAHMAVSTADGPVWELLALGVPTVVVADPTSPTVPGVEAAIAAGAAVAAAGPGAVMDVLLRLIDPTARRQVSRTALEVVDGQGADRLLRALLA